MRNDMEPLEPEITDVLERRHGIGAAAVVERTPLPAGAIGDGPPGERVTLPATQDGAVSYVVRRLRPRGDWVSRATSDERLREFQLHQAGIFRALPSEIVTPIAATARLSDDGIALIMQDVSGALIPPGNDPISDDHLKRSVLALARLHSAFYGFPARLTTGLGLATIGHWLTLFAPATMRREQAINPDTSVVSETLRGWSVFAGLAANAWDILQPLLADPSPLVRTLRECPDTFVHGNARTDNIGLTADQVILLDWSQTLRGPGALDLGWYLAVNAARLPSDPGSVIETYRVERQRLGRLPADGDLWHRELALSLLAGAMRGGWALALDASSEDACARERARNDLGYWAGAVVDAQRWL